jgi:thioredoxin-related protein
MAMTRRGLLLAAAASGAGAVALPRAYAEEPQLTAEGLIAEPWFLESFLDLPDDLASTHKEGKRFVIMWELRGCPYCRETHLVNFAQARIADYIKANFEVLQLNIIGDRKVTDFDGTELPEKALAAKYAIHFTPTFQFFPETAAELAGLAPQKREVARAPGYLRPDDFLAFFRFVREKAYEKGSFRDFLKSQPS